ncbi:Mitotic checkpoint serine/threonine-protein kinase BUB1 [Zootermopsis nevadensis]|uniref:Mitotic checkpoint serine/threonine-protein kinase BUB1 n=1 Tax=Zootermopsis nevadensis TaxID=136037 RepID=A0A067QTX0_ZOONE|nr:Mitotic checkpoint serine/threonine-protein kinase BUB1 [Zootermopsis nevadensis]
MVDPAEEFELSKENIQPLKKGRVICQLGTALLAQDDQQAHHELFKQREKYEVLLRSYEGNDPLEPWYEYISWVEQSFLRDGREGNLNILLERCLAQFKDDERYLQDRRYIELWIKYIEMSINPLQVYKRCHAHGIGKYCALFYMAWAFEFEKAGDIKRANQVFSEGFKNYSQPRDELEEVHKNFQLRVARQVLSGISEVEAVCTEQRVVLNRLKAVGRKRNCVRNVRVGENVQQGFAGVLQPITQRGHRSGNTHSDCIEVFNDVEDNIGIEFAVLEEHLSSIPRREIINKENSLEPGPWTKKYRKMRTAAASVSRPSFELHQDEEIPVKNPPLLICNALKPRKLDGDEIRCAIAVFEPEDPSKRFMYCKNKVYAGGLEFSFEELAAIEYFKGNRPLRCKKGGSLHDEVCDQEDELSCPIALFESPNPARRPMYCKGKVYTGGTEFSFEELRAFEYLKRNRPKSCKQACTEECETDSEPTVAKLYGEQFSLFVGAGGAEDAGFGTKSHVLDAENAAPECPKLLGNQSNWIRNGDENGGITAASSDVLSKLSHMKPLPTTDSSYDSAKMPNEASDQSLSHQSLTYHTKEAMNMIHEFWTTPENTNLQYNMSHADGFDSKKKKLLSEYDVDTQCLHPEQPKININPFEIFKDESEAQEEGKNYSFCASQPERKAGNFGIFRDETEVMGQMQNCSGNLPVPAQQKSQFGWTFGDNVQILHNERRENLISEPTEAINENCPFNYFKDENISPDTEGIPFVPSPGMTEEEENALKGTEMKENIAPEDFFAPKAEKRKMAGFLQPSTDLPCDPLDDPALQGELQESETCNSNVTCFTQAFSCPLFSSTPSVGKFKQLHGMNTTESSAKSEYWQKDEGDGTCSSYDSSTNLIRFGDGSEALAGVGVADKVGISAVEDGAGAFLKSDEVGTHRSAGSATQTAETLGIIMETTGSCKSSSSSSSGVATTCHTTILSQENCTTGSTRKSENIDKIRRNSEQQIDIAYKSQENPSVQEVLEPSQHCSSDNFIIRTFESLYYKTENIHHRSSNSNYMMGQSHLPEEPDPSQKVYGVESIKSLLQEEVDLHEKQNRVQGCQQITGNNSGFSNNSTVLGSELQDDEILLRSEQENLSHAKVDHKRENETDGGANKDKSSRTQENSLTREVSMLNLEGHKDIDPFDHTLIQQLLTHLGFPKAEDSEHYVKLNVPVPRFKIGGTVTLGKDKFAIEKILGEGSYAKVFKATDIKTQKTVALKVQKPSWEWEFYVCRQLQSRLSDPLSALAFMDVQMAYTLNSGSIMVTEYSHYGSLLSVIIKLRQQWSVPENLMLYWMSELLLIAEKLQECHIIHGDIKPDNFVLRNLPSCESRQPSLQLIDMGRGIDMTLFPEGTTFNTVVTTKDFQCIEMQTKRPWTYQTDLYGIAGTMHCVYFSQYMKVHKDKDGRWFIQQSISRYSKRHLWEQFFFTLLNVESCEKLPNLSQLRSLVDAEVLSSNCVSDFAPVRIILGDKLKK